MGRRLLREKKRPNILIRDSELRNHRREQVAAAALDLFLHDGFHNTGIRQIAQKAKVSPGAVLTYFKDKEEILFHIFDREQEKPEKAITEIVTRLRPALRNGVNVWEAFEQVLDTFLRSIDAVSRFVLLAYQETKSLRPEWREELFARERRIQRLLVEMMRYGVEQGIFSPEQLTVKAHNIIVLAHAWAVRRWALKEIASIDEYSAVVKPLVLGMLAVPTDKTQKKNRLRASQEAQRRVA